VNPQLLIFPTATGTAWRCWSNETRSHTDCGAEAEAALARAKDDSHQSSSGRISANALHSLMLAAAAAAALATAERLLHHSSEVEQRSMRIVSSSAVA